MRVSMLWLVACGGSPGETGDTGARPAGPTEAAELVDMGAWVPSEADPEPTHRQADDDCPEAGWGLEGSVLEVETGTCSYGVLEQPLLAELWPGDEVELVWWHNQLVSEEPATGHVLLTVGGHVLYEREVAIPHEPDAYTETVTVSERVEAGEPVVLHLHNHGANSWSFLRVERLAAPAR